MAGIRLLGFAWLMHVKMMSRSAFDGMLAVLWPLFFATVAFFMFRTGHGSSALGPIGLAAAVMGIWTATSVPASSALQRERWLGTLELLVVAPRHLGLILLPITLAASTVGLYCVAGTLLWARILFGIHLTIVHPLLFALGLLATVVTIAALGFLMAVSFVGSRRAWALGSAVEYPVWLICGFLVPVSLLPDWVRPLSWALGPTWGMRAVREAAYGGAPVGPILLCLALAAVYLGLGVAVLRFVIDSARRRATLSLA
ncbi:MAG: type transport system permease protein [Gaiellaceae bacterium]|jgi:ABC-2 type transport system permease protein|nr:type transport system permease protein [Gaiellaceae bacterium]